MPTNRETASTTGLIASDFNSYPLYGRRFKCPQYNRERSGGQITPTHQTHEFFLSEKEPQSFWDSETLRYPLAALATQVRLAAQDESPTQSVSADFMLFEVCGSSSQKKPHSSGSAKLCATGYPFPPAKRQVSSRHTGKVALFDPTPSSWASVAE